MARDRGEEVGGGLLWWAVPAHLFEVCLYSFCGSKIDLMSLIENNNPVKGGLNGLRCFVDSNGMRDSEDVGTCS